MLIAPVVSIELADKTNLEVVLPNVCPDEFDVGTIAVALIVTPVVVCEAAFTVPVWNAPVVLAIKDEPTVYEAAFTVSVKKPETPLNEVVLIVEKTVELPAFNILTVRFAYEKDGSAMLITLLLKTLVSSPSVDMRRNSFDVGLRTRPAWFVVFPDPL
jgi:hypothetical protein